jgi:metal-responsive CopG/Arc/MetJ family transcriptional regulator
MTNKISVSTLANRSISISLEEGLLAQLDAQGSNRSALVSEALSQWLARRRIDALNMAYAHLASLEAGDLAEAGEAAVAMGLAALAAEAGG